MSMPVHMVPLGSPGKGVGKTFLMQMNELPLPTGRLSGVSGTWTAEAEARGKIGVERINKAVLQHEGNMYGPLMHVCMHASVLAHLERVRHHAPRVSEKLCLQHRGFFQGSVVGLDEQTVRSALGT